jgi:predicted nucleic acid-binding protein
MRILPDTNIVPDIALARVPNHDDSADFFREIDNESIYAFVTATTITDNPYLGRRKKGHQIIIDFFSDLIEIVDVIGIDWEIVKALLKAVFVDFKDARRSVLSYLNKIDSILTSNLNDFLKSVISALSPKEYMALLKMKKL